MDLQGFTPDTIFVHAIAQRKRATAYFHEAMTCIKTLGPLIMVKNGEIKLRGTRVTGAINGPVHEFLGNALAVPAREHVDLLKLKRFLLSGGDRSAQGGQLCIADGLIIEGRNSPADFLIDKILGHRSIYRISLLTKSLEVLSIVVMYKRLAENLTGHRKQAQTKLAIWTDKRNHR